MPQKNCARPKSNNLLYPLQVCKGFIFCEEGVPAKFSIPKVSTMFSFGIGMIPGKYQPIPTKNTKLVSNSSVLGTQSWPRNCFGHLLCLTKVTHLLRIGGLEDLFFCCLRKVPPAHPRSACIHSARIWLVMHVRN